MGTVVMEGEGHLGVVLVSGPWERLSPATARSWKGGTKLKRTSSDELVRS